MCMCRVDPAPAGRNTWPLALTLSPRERVLCHAQGSARGDTTVSTRRSDPDAWRRGQHRGEAISYAAPTPQLTSHRCSVHSSNPLQTLLRVASRSPWLVCDVRGWRRWHGYHERRRCSWFHDQFRWHRCGGHHGGGQGHRGRGKRRARRRIRSQHWQWAGQQQEAQGQAAVAVQCLCPRGQQPCGRHAVQTAPATGLLCSSSATLRFHTVN